MQQKVTQVLPGFEWGTRYRGGKYAKVKMSK